MWNDKKLAVIVIFTCIFAVSFCSSAAASSEPNAAELIRTVRESENWIHKVDSLLIRIESKWTRAPGRIAATQAELKEQDKDCEPEVRQLSKLKPSSKGILEYAFDEGRIRFFNQESDSWCRLTIWDGKQLITHEETYFYNGQELYYLDWTPQGNFSELIAFQTSWPRAQPHSFWWDRKDVEELMCYYGRPEEFVVTGSSNYNGVDCYVLEFNPKELWGLVTGQSYRCDAGIEDRLRYGRIGEARALADQSYRWYIGTKDHRLYGLVWLVRKKPHVEHSMFDYREVSPGCWFPMTQGYELYSQDGDSEHYLEARRDLKVLEVRINEKLPDELFQIKFNKAVKVIDNRSGRSITYMYEPHPLDLIGKALPDFRDIKIELAHEHIQNGISLVCFWDKDQRPSRYCIKKLAERAKELKDKSVTVVAIQASKVDKNSLSEWVKKYNIPFPIGMIQEDEEQTRFNWGVKSLPWLILTDRKHIVTEEGFTVSEIGDILK